MKKQRVCLQAEFKLTMGLLKLSDYWSFRFFPHKPDFHSTIGAVA